MNKRSHKRSCRSMLCQASWHIGRRLRQ